MSNVVSMFPASGIEIAPAGYARLTLQWSTSDGANPSVTYAITDGTHSYTVKSNDYGYAEQLVASGGTYTVTVTHGGTYLGAGTRKITAESTKGYYLCWNAWIESELQAIIIVTTDAGATVTATDQSTSGVYTVTADSTGSATLSGMQAGHTYTVKADGGLPLSTSIKVEHIVSYLSITGVTSVSLTVTALSGTAIMITDTSDGSRTTATVPSSGSYTKTDARSTRTYTVTGTLSNVQDTTSVTVALSAVTVALDVRMRYGVKIACDTADDMERCVYIDGATGFTPFARISTTVFTAGSWDGNALISGIKPINRSGTTTTDLDKTTLSGVSTTSSADAFVHIPTWWLSITVDDDNIYIRFSNYQIDSTYVKYSSLYNGSDRGYFDFGMFHGIVSSSQLYSRSRVTPTASTSITDFINYAQARGDGYDIINYDEVTYLTALFILLFKRTNFQAAIGNGYTAGGSAAASVTAISNFGNAYGMYGDTSGSASTVVFFWIHDFIGNVSDLVGGAKTNSSAQLMRIVGKDSSVIESDFTLQSDTPTGSRTGYVSDVVATSAAIGFLPRICKGAATGFWCDGGSIYASCFPFWGGNWDSDTNAGPFNWSFRSSAAVAYTYVGSRLSYRPPR